MKRSVDGRLTALENRRFERRWRREARADGLGVAETAGYVADMRREVARLRAGLPPRTVEDVIAEHADRLGLTGEERARWVAESRRYVEERRARAAT